MEEEKGRVGMDIIQDLGIKEDQEPITEPTIENHIDDSEVRVRIEKIHAQKFKFDLTGKRSSKNIGSLERLVESVRQIGMTSDIERIFPIGKEENYRISFILNTDRYGSNLIEAVKEMIKDAQFLLEYENIMRDIRVKDRVLGEWLDGDYNTRSKIAGDMEKIYGYLKENYEISMEDVLNTKKRSGAIPLARAAISYIIRNKKYNESGKKLSLTNIADILGGINHATVLLGINKCKEAELTKNDLDDFPKALEEIFKVYRGRKPRKI